MSKSYQADNELVSAVQLKVQTLQLAFVINGSSTPASVSPRADDPEVLFFNTEGVNQITAELDAGSVAPIFASPKDSVSSGPMLGSAASYGVLASSTTTNTGSSVVTGDLGLYPGTSVTGYPPGIVSGSMHVTDAAAQQAQIDATAAYVDLQSRSGAIDKSGIDLGTLTLAPGVYSYSTSAQLTGTLHLDAAGDPDAVWIFKIGSTLTTASSSVVAMLNGGLAGNVYWQVGTSATIGTSTTFLGTIIANASITVNTSASVAGHLFALTGAVTLDTNAVAVAKGTSGSVYNLLVKLYDERIKKIVSAIVICNGPAGEIYACSFPSSPAKGIVAGKSFDMMAFNAQSSLPFNSSGARNCCLEVSYIVSET